MRKLTLIILITILTTSICALVDLVNPISPNGVPLGQNHISNAINEAELHQQTQLSQSDDQQRPRIEFSSRSEYEDLLQAALDNSAEEQGIMGISAVVEHPIAGTWIGTTGISHDDVPIDPDMIFGIASNTKTFVAALTLLLAEEDLLDLDDPISEYLQQDYEYIDGDITIRQLLNHTSGIYRVFYDPNQICNFLADLEYFWTPEEILANCVGPPSFEPGTDWQYSNTNYIVMGMVIEATTGSQLHVELRNRLLDPLGLERTYMAVHEELIEPLAHNWNPYGGSYLVDLTIFPWVWLSCCTASGAMFSTASDLAYWTEQLHFGNVLSEDSYASMYDFVPNNWGSEYGLGVEHWQSRGRNIYGHPGDIAGYLSLTGYVLEESVTITLLTNTNVLTQNTYWIFNDILDVILDYEWITILDIEVEITGGDEDLVINPGETVNIYPILLNNTSLSFDSVSASLTCEEQQITVTSNFVDYGQLAGSSSSDIPENAFSIEIGQDAALGDPNCVLDLVAVQLQADTLYLTAQLDLTISLDQEGWPFYTEQPVHTSPALVDLDSDGSPPEIIFGDDVGFLHVVDLAGVERDNWPHETGFYIAGSPAVSDIDLDGIIEIVFGALNGHLYILESDGSIQLDLDVGMNLLGTPAIGNLDDDDDLEIVIGTYDNPLATNQILAINPDGSPVPGFPYILGEWIQGGVSLADFNGNNRMDIVCGTDGDNLYLVFDDGTLAPGFPFTEAAGNFSQAPVILRLVTGEMIILAGNTDDHFYAVNSDGSLRYSIPTGSDVKTSCAIVGITDYGPVAIFGTNTGLLYALDSDGNSLEGWPLDLGMDMSLPINTTPVIADLNNDGTADIITDMATNKIAVIDLGGNYFPHFPMDYSIKGSPLVIDIDGDSDLEILFGINDGLANIDIKETGNVDGYWHIYRGNYERTGFYDASLVQEVVGDINGDLSLDILDVVQAVECIVEEPFHDCELADVNEDGVVDVSDVVLMVAIIMEV